jgi:hypothetical protein
MAWCRVRWPVPAEGLTDAVACPASCRCRWVLLLAQTLARPGQHGTSRANTAYFAAVCPGLKVVRGPTPHGRLQLWHPVDTVSSDDNRSDDGGGGGSGGRAGSFGLLGDTGRPLVVRRPGAPPVLIAPAPFWQAKDEASLGVVGADEAVALSRTPCDMSLNGKCFRRGRCPYLHITSTAKGSSPSAVAGSGGGGGTGGGSGSGSGAGSGAGSGGGTAKVGATPTVAVPAALAPSTAESDAAPLVAKQSAAVPSLGGPMLAAPDVASGVKALSRGSSEAAVLLDVDPTNVGAGTAAVLPTGDLLL